MKKKRTQGNPPTSAKTIGRPFKQGEGGRPPGARNHSTRLREQQRQMYEGQAHVADIVSKAWGERVDAIVQGLGERAAEGKVPAIRELMKLQSAPVPDFEVNQIVARMIKAVNAGNPSMDAEQFERDVLEISSRNADMPEVVEAFHRRIRDFRESVDSIHRLRMEKQELQARSDWSKFANVIVGAAERISAGVYQTPSEASEAMNRSLKREGLDLGLGNRSPKPDGK